MSSITKWAPPPRIKVYEALGCLADRRLRRVAGGARVRSSSGGKEYVVKYGHKTGAIAANDNGSYWRGYLGYPAIAYLLATGLVPYDKSIAAALRGVPWKDINTRFGNDFAKTEAYVKKLAAEKGIAAAQLTREVARIMKEIKRLAPAKLPLKLKPPIGY